MEQRGKRGWRGPPQPCGSRDGRQHGEQDQGARARPALGACATRLGRARRQYVDGLPWSCIDAAS
eukprot:scaffold11042_cov98-Phaeocystis_antarctica.AAC.5